MQKYGWEELEKKLAQKRTEWKNNPEKRHVIEAEVRVLKVGIAAMKRKANGLTREEQLSVDAQQALL